jgi:hypothetical protein
MPTPAEQRAALARRRSGLSAEQRKQLERRLEPAASNEDRITRRRDAGPVPLSFAQQRLWYLHQLHPDSPCYNEAVVLRLRGPLRRERLESALNRSIARHESLRTTFMATDAGPLQRVAPHLHLPLALVDCRDLGARGQDRLAQLAAREALRPFDLARGPLVRAVLVEQADDDHTLLLTLHHIVCDGWSMSVLARDVSALYEAEVTGRAPALPELTIQYPDYCAWQRQHLAETRLPAQLDYWVRQLRGVEMLVLPSDRPRPPVQSFRGAEVGFEIPASLVAELARLSSRLDATVFMTTFSAFAALLHRLSGQTDLLLGVVHANRSHEQLEPLIGFFVNLLAVRLDLSGDPAFTSLVTQARRVTLDAFAHQDAPFEQVVAAVQPHRGLDQAPLCQVVFAFQNTPPSQVSLAGLECESLAYDRETCVMDLIAYLEPVEGRLRGRIEYSCDLFDRRRIEQMIAYYLQILAGIVAMPEERLIDLPLGTPHPHAPMSPAPSTDAAARFDFGAPRRGQG